MAFQQLQQGIVAASLAIDFVLVGMWLVHLAEVPLIAFQAMPSPSRS